MSEVLTRAMIAERWGEGCESPTARRIRQDEEDDWDGNGAEAESQERCVSPSLLLESGMRAMFGTERGRDASGAISPSLQQHDEEETADSGAGILGSVQQGFVPIGMCPTRLLEEAELQMRQRQSKESDVVMYQCNEGVQRSSRTARPCEPSDGVAFDCFHAMGTLKAALNSAGYKPRASQDATTFRGGKGGTSNGKGPGVKTEDTDQAKMNHMISIKSKSMDQNNGDPFFLMNGRSAPPKYDRLAKLAIKTNAVHSSVTERAKTQAAANQTSRINYVPIGQAAASQLVNCELTMAMARESIRQTTPVVNPIATNDVNMATLVLRPRSELEGAEQKDPVFVTTTTTQLLYNVCPTKLGDGSVIGVARMLARKELEDQYISETMGYASEMLTCICDAIVAPGEYDQDAVWSSWFLIVYMMSDPRGRRLLANVPLTDLDYHVAVAFEAYGRAELTRRARLRRQQQSAAEAKRSKKAKHVLVEASPPEESEANAASSGATEDLSALNLDEEKKKQEEIDYLIIQMNEEIEQKSPKGDQSSSNVEEAAAAMEASDDKVIATKRRRSGKGQASASSSDATGLLEWWFRALRNPDKSVLLTLVAYCRAAARDAAGETLGRQVGDKVNVASNEIIQDIAQRAAVKSAEALAPFVGRKTNEVPSIKAVLVKRHGGKPFLAAGFVRMREQERNTLLTCCRIKESAQAFKEGVGIVVAWCEHSRKLKPELNKQGETCVNVLERMRYMSDLKKGMGNLSDAKRNQQYLLHKTWVASEASPPMPTRVSGITRSFISMKVRLPVCKQHKRASNALLSEWNNLQNDIVSNSKVENAQTSNMPSEATVLGDSQDGNRVEPFCSGNSHLVLGVGLNEAKRVWLHGKTRKNDQCKWSAKLHFDHEVPKDFPSIDDTEPSPMLTMTDMSLESMNNCNPEDKFGDGDRFENKSFCAGLTVCGDGAIRLTEAIHLLNSEFDVLQICALVWVGISQSSYVGDVGASICAGYANTAIASSKKMSVADNNKAYNLTCFDCYVAGLMNLHPDFVNTSWAGMYGCRLDHGLSPPGLMAHNYRSDKRQHGNMMLRQAAANELCVRFAKRRWIYDKESKTYDAMPPQTLGIPHNFTPGVHANMEHYQQGIEKIRGLLGRQECDTQDSVMVLPCSVFSQGLPPDIEATADHSTRLCVRDKEQLSTIAGKAYLPDATEFEKALLKEPMWRRPCQASIQDNPFATSYEHGTSFFGSACGLAQIAIAIGGVQELHRIMELWHSDDDVVDAVLTPAYCIYAANAMMLLSTMYPVTWHIDEKVIPPSYASMLPVVMRKYTVEDVRQATELRMCGLGCSDALVADAKKFWGAMRVRNAVDTGEDPAGKNDSTWTCGVEPLLNEIVLWQGSHDMSIKQHEAMAEAIDNAARAAWLQHSVDGVTAPPTPCPAGEVSCWKRVRRPQLDPVFVGDEKTGAQARGCLVGLKPHQLRQICSLAIGSHLENVEVQAVRNEGGLSLRISSAADMLDEKGKLRSLKSISPVQTEGECDGYGSRKDKENGAPKQRNAWDKNAILLEPICTALSEPLDPSIRGRGEIGRPNKKQAEANTQMSVSMEVAEQCEALDAFLTAFELNWEDKTDQLLSSSSSHGN